MAEMTKVDGLPMLLRAVAGRIESDVNGINKELLMRAAEKLDELELVAETAVAVVACVATGGDGAARSMVPRMILIELSDRLRHAGKDVRKLRV